MSANVRLCVDAALALLEALDWHEELGVWVLRSDTESTRAIINLAVAAVRLREANQQEESS